MLLTHFGETPEAEIGPGDLRAPPEVAFTMRSWPLLAQFGNYFVVLGPLMEQNLTFVLQKIKLKKNCPPLVYLYL